MMPITKVAAVASENAWWMPLTMAGMSGSTCERNAAGTWARIVAPRSPTRARLFSAEPPPDANWPANCAGTPAAVSCFGTSSSITEPKIEPVMASPTVPPSCWNRVTLLVVAVPSSVTGTAFCTTSVKAAKHGPIPTPAIAIQSQTSGCGVSGRRWVSRKRPTASTTRAATDQRLVSAGARDQLAGRDRRDDQAAQQRQDRIARRGRRAAVHDLVPARQEDDGREEAHRREEERQHARREGADPEEAQRQDRLLAHATRPK